MPDPAELQKNYKEFIELLPITVALAGLPVSQGRYYTEDQIEARLFTVKHAWKAVRTVVPDPIEAPQKYREFMDLVPLTLALAGLPVSEAGKYYSADQIEGRVFTMKYGYKAARSVTRECITPPG